MLFVKCKSAELIMISPILHIKMQADIYAMMRILLESLACHYHSARHPRALTDLIQTLQLIKHGFIEWLIFIVFRQAIIILLSILQRLSERRLRILSDLEATDFQERLRLIFFIISSQTALELTNQMKKRVSSSSSLQKTDKLMAGVVQLDIKKQHKQQMHKHHARCPLPKPRCSTRKQKVEDVDAIKQLKTPILNDLRTLIVNFINSSDRILQYLQKEDHKHSQNIYQEDRKKLLHYLNSLVVRPVDFTQLKARVDSLKSKPKFEQNYYCSSKNEISTQEQLGGEKQDPKGQAKLAAFRKRSKSSMAHFQSSLEKEVSEVKSKINQLQKRTERNQAEGFSSFLKLCEKFSSMAHKQVPNNPQSSEFIVSNELESVRSRLAKEVSKTQNLSQQFAGCKAQLQGIKSRLAYIELLLFKCGQILKQSMNQRYQNDQFYMCERSKITLLLSTLSQIADYLRSHTDNSADVMHKLKQEAQETIQYLSELRKRSLDLLQEKQRLFEELKEQRQFHRRQSSSQELKLHIQRLNNEISDLVQEVDFKDEQLQRIKQENIHLQDDLKSMEEHIQQTQRDYHNICQEMEQVNDKLKASEAILQAKDEQLLELGLEVADKKTQISEKIKEIQSKELEINNQRAHNRLIEEFKAQVQRSSAAQTSLLSLQIEQKAQKLYESRAKVKQLQNKIEHLLQLNQNAADQKDINEERFNNLELRIHALESQNQQLYNDIRGSEKLQQTLEENNLAYQLLYKQLQHQCSELREQIQQNHKKIHFYEEKVLELAQLASENIFQMYGEGQQKNFVYKVMKPEEYTENAQKQEEPKEPDTDALFNRQGGPRSMGVKSDHSDQYVPFLLQNCAASPKNSDFGKQNSPAFLNVQAKDAFQQAGMSALTHYDIYVLNENMDEIDAHKAVYPKQSKPIRIAEEAEFSDPLLKDSPSLSNFADGSQSIPKTQAPSNVKPDNILQVGLYKIGDFEEQIQRQDHFNSIQKVPGFIVSESLGQKKSNESLNDQFLLRNVDKEQALKAELRLSGERGEFIDNQKYHTEKKSKRKRSSEKDGNVYIRMKRQNAGFSTISSERCQRSKSCFQKQL